MNEPTMLDDLLATDLADIEPTAVATTSLEFQSLEGFSPLDLRKLGAAEFSVIIACLMKRQGWTTLQINDSEVSSLNTSDGLCTVLACEIDPSTCDLRFTLSQTQASEFHS